MAPAVSIHSRSRRRRLLRTAALVLAAGLAGCSLFAAPARAQQRLIVDFPPRPKVTLPPGQQGLMQSMQKKDTKEQMLVRADEINYDYTNERVSAVGNVQIYYSGTTLEGDRVIYDQKTKRLHAEGNIRLTEPDGKVTYGEIIDLSDDFRDGFVDSLRLESADETRIAANRADRSTGNFTVFESAVYTACEPCKDDPKKPPKWQVKAARLIHDQGEKMMYFEDARVEFFGVPLIYMPYFSSPDPSAKRKTGFLMPSMGSGSTYGFAVSTPYYWALAPNYDATITPTITSKQGPLAQVEFRHRLMDGSYTIRAAGIWQLDRAYFPANGDTPGDRDFRGSVQSNGQFSLNDKWVWGWDATALTDKSFFQDYRISRMYSATNTQANTPDYALSQLYLAGRGDRSYFDIRSMYFYGFSAADDQKQIPIIHPVLDHDYTVDQPIFGGQVTSRSNLTSLSRQSANFDPISALAISNGMCSIATADPAIHNLTNCLLRGVPGEYTRASNETTWRTTYIDPFGQVFKPFVTLRTDVASVNVTNEPGVGNYIKPGDTDVARVMPVAGVEYRYPFISAQSWGSQTIEPIAQVIVRPNETGINKLPNEDAQSLIFDDSNLFSVNKFSGWDRVEGGGRANVGVQYTAQVNRGGFLNVLFGQSYQLFGQNSYTLGGTTNTGLDSGLDKARSDYVARLSFQPMSSLMFTSRFRFDESTFGLQRTELEATTNFDRWSGTVMYGNYAAQPDLGYPDRREGVLGSGRVKVTPNWMLLGAARYDLRADKLSQTQIGVGYIDDCLILALNYITDYAYNSTTQLNHTVMFQFSLRTLGGNTVSQGLGQSSLSALPIPGMSK